METITDIVRKVAEEMLNTSMQDITAEVINGWATRLGDAATCSKSSQVGDTTKMREALKKVIEIANREWNAFRETAAMFEMREICTTALSAPPRNCDVFPEGKLVDGFCAFMHYDVMDPKNGFADGLWEFMRENWYTFSLWVTHEYKKSKAMEGATDGKK